MTPAHPETGEVTGPTDEQREVAHSLWRTRCRWTPGDDPADHSVWCSNTAIVLYERDAAAERRGGEPFVRAMSSMVGDKLAGMEMLRKDVSNGVFGWWVRGTGQGADVGYISLPNLVAVIRKTGK